MIAERHRFYTRSQGANETVQDFVADLRRLAITCEFGDFLDQALRDRFVCGLRVEAVQRVLLTEAGLTLARAVEIAQAKETASQNIKGLKIASGSTTQALMQVRRDATPDKDHSPMKGKLCHRCGRRGHEDSGCRFKDAT